MSELLHNVDRRRPRRGHASGVSVESVLTEQAKGVLMLRYGINSYEALAVLARWAHESASSIDDLARALTHGICQGRDLGSHQDAWLVRWLEQQLRCDVPDAS
jgi:hypothetical protein